MSANSPTDLSKIYQQRFEASLAYRKAIWQTLISGFFAEYLRPDAVVLDLGCGYGEFINQVQAAQRYGMDLNPDTRQRLSPEVTFLEQDCSTRWPLPDHSLDVVFTSNFFEHLPDKSALGRTLDEACRCLKEGGRLIALGPNIKYLPGTYWDFWDHHLALTELSLEEALTNRTMAIEKSIPRFLPYTMARGWQPPLAFVALFLKLPFLWKWFGRQFLVVARKPAATKT
ncbi:MAG: class I SAM-dependent methyltransferase [Chthoniobacterales bacterium]